MDELISGYLTRIKLGRFLRGFLKQSTIYGVGQILVKFALFILVPVFARVFSLKEYGIVSLYMIFWSVIHLIYTLGIPQAFLRYFFPEDKVLTEEEQRSVFSTAFYMLTFIAVLISTCIASTADQLAQLIFKDRTCAPLIWVMAIALVFEASLQVSRALLRALKKPNLHVGLDVGRHFMAAGLIILMLVKYKLGVIAVGYGFLIGDAVVWFISLYVVRNYLRWRFDLSLCPKFLRFGIPLVPTALAMWVLGFADQYILRVFRTMEEVGLYGLAYRVGMIVSYFVVAPLNLTWSAAQFEIYQKEGKNIHTRYSKVLFLFVFVSLSVAVTLSIFSPEIIKILGTKKFMPAVGVVPLVALGYVFYGIYLVDTVGISLAKRTGYLALLTGIMAIFNVLLNCLWIPKWGITGAAVATCISYMGLALLGYLFNQRIFRINFRWREPILSIVIGATFITCATFIKPIGWRVGLWVGYWVVMVMVFFRDIFGQTIKALFLSDR
ncbi:flippase [candidate division WOR-3 bacterium]|nr:flippase [candidate division WOR-3 bacterium]